MAAICTFTEKQIIDFQKHLLSELVLTKDFKLELFFNDIYQTLGSKKNEDLAFAYILLVLDMLFELSNIVELEQYFNKELLTSALDYKFLFKRDINNVRNKLLTKEEDTQLLETLYSFADNHLSLYFNIDNAFAKINENQRKGLITKERALEQIEFIENYYTNFMYELKLGNSKSILKSLYFQVKSANLKEQEEIEDFIDRINTIQSSLKEVLNANKSYTKKQRLQIAKDFLKSRVVYNTNFQNRSENSGTFFQLKKNDTDETIKSKSERLIYINVSQGKEQVDKQTNEYVIKNEEGVKTIGYFLNLYKDYYYDETDELILLVLQLVGKPEEFKRIFNTSSVSDYEDFVFYMNFLKYINENLISNEESNELLNKMFDINYRLKYLKEKDFDKLKLKLKLKDKKKISLVYNNIVINNETKRGKSFATIIDFNKSDILINLETKQREGGAILKNGLIINVQFKDFKWQELENDLFNSLEDEDKFNKRIYSLKSLYNNRYQLYSEFIYKGELKGYFILLSLKTISYSDKAENNKIFDKIIELINIQNNNNLDATRDKIIEFNNSYFFATKLSIDASYELEIRLNNRTTFKNNKMVVDDVLYNSTIQNIRTEAQSSLTITLTKLEKLERTIIGFKIILLSVIEKLKKDYNSNKDNYYYSFGQFLVKTFSDSQNKVDFGQDSIIKKRFADTEDVSRYKDYIEDFEILYLYNYTKTEITFHLKFTNFNLIVNESKRIDLVTDESSVELIESIISKQENIRKPNIGENAYVLTTDDGEVLFTRVSNIINNEEITRTQSLVLGDIVDNKIKKKFGKENLSKRIDEELNENVKLLIILGNVEKLLNSELQLKYYNNSAISGIGTINYSIDKHYNNLNSYLINNGYEYVESDVIVYGELNGLKIAGEIDFIFKNKFGDYYIIDVKATGQTNDKIKTSENYIAQLTAYKYIFSKQYNILLDKIKIAIALIKTAYNDKLEILQLLLLVKDDEVKKRKLDLIVELNDDYSDYLDKIKTFSQLTLLEINALILVESNEVKTLNKPLTEEIVNNAVILNESNSLKLISNLVDNINSIIFVKEYNDNISEEDIENIAIKALTDDNIFEVELDKIDLKNKTIISDLLSYKDELLQTVDLLILLEDKAMNLSEKNGFSDIENVKTKIGILNNVIDYIKEIENNLSKFLEKNKLSIELHTGIKFKSLSYDDLQKQIKELKKQC